MNKREDGSLLREKGLTVMCIKTTINSICDPMWCLAVEYVYLSMWMIYILYFKGYIKIYSKRHEVLYEENLTFQCMFWHGCYT